MRFVGECQKSSGVCVGPSLHDLERLLVRRHVVLDVAVATAAVDALKADEPLAVDDVVEVLAPHEQARIAAPLRAPRARSAWCTCGDAARSTGTPCASGPGSASLARLLHRAARIRRRVAAAEVAVTMRNHPWPVSAAFPPPPPSPPGRRRRRPRIPPSTGAGNPCRRRPGTGPTVNASRCCRPHSEPSCDPARPGSWSDPRSSADKVHGVPLVKLPERDVEDQVFSGQFDEPVVREHGADRRRGLRDARLDVAPRAPARRSSLYRLAIAGPGATRA